MASHGRHRARRQLRHGSIVIALAFLGGFTLLTSPAWALPGVLDSGFGTGGKVTTSVGSGDSVGNGMAIQADGMIVVVGQSDNGTNTDFAVARYDSSGSLDQSFGSNGIATTNLGHNDSAYGVAIQSNGKIVAAGIGGSFYFGLARYNTDGSLDGSFGPNGTVLTSLSQFGSHAYAVALQSDGKIVAGGDAYGTNYDFALARYNTDGSLDTSFGSNGKVTTAIGPKTDRIVAMAIQPDGKILAAGYASNGTNDDFAIARYNTDGSLDTSFGSNGIVTQDFTGGDDHIHGIAIQPNGKILAVGYASNGISRAFALARYNSDGSLDTGFGSSGLVTTALVPGGDDEANAAVVQSDGKIVADGQSYNGANSDFAVARYNSDGTLDPTFGSSCGTAITPIGIGSDIANAVALQSDGKIVASGTAHIGGTDDFGLVRYQGGTAPTIYRPDGLIRLSTQSLYRGNNIYNLTGSKQTAAASVKRGTNRVFFVEVQNDGNTTDSITLHGSGSKPGFTVKYLAGSNGTTGITSQVVGGTYVTSNLAPCAGATIRAVVTVKRTTTVGAIGSWLVVATSNGQPILQDAVKAKIKVA